MFAGRSIIFKTSSIIGTSIAILLILMGTFFVMSEKALINEIQDRKLQDLEQNMEDRKASEIKSMETFIKFVAGTIGNVSSEYIYNIDEDGLKMQLQNFLEIQEVVAIDVIDAAAGKTFIAAWTEGGEVKYAPKLPEQFKTDKFKNMAMPSSYQEETVGEVVVYYSDQVILEKIAQIQKKIQANFKQEKEHISGQLASSTTIQIVIIAAIVALLVLLTVFALKKMVKQPLQVLQSAMEDLINKKDGSSDYIDIFTDDEIGTVAKFFNRYITKMVYGSEIDNTLLGDAVSVVEKVKAGNLTNRLKEEKSNPALYKLQQVVNDMLGSLDHYTQDILRTLNSYSHDDFTVRSTKDEIGGEIEKLIDGVNYLGDSLSRIFSENLRNGLSLENDSRSLSETANVLTNTFRQQSEMITNTTHALDEMTNELESNRMKIDSMTNHARDMKEVISIIGDIADQTNLLALNAAIEAARAGEHGRGFAVVSDEVRKLAEKTQKSLSEINVSINSLIQSVEEVADTFKEQAKGIENINQTISEIDHMTMQSSEATDKIGSISSEVSNMANALVQDSKTKKFNEILDVPALERPGSRTEDDSDDESMKEESGKAENA